MTEINPYLIALMVFIFGLSVIIIAGKGKTEGSPPKSIGQYIAGGFILSVLSMLMLVVFLGLLTLLKWLWIGLIN